MRLELRILDTDVEIATDDEALFSSIHALTASYPRGGPATLRYELRAGSLARDGVVLCSGLPPAALARALEVDFFTEAVERAKPSFMVHSAALELDGRALLLSGPSGAGKTTMSRAMIARGARYITDEFCAIDRAGRVRGVPRPLYTREVPAGSHQERIAGVVHHYRLADGAGLVDVPLLAPEEAHIVREPTLVAYVVLLRHAPNERTGLAPLAKSRALTRLWGERQRFGQGELEIAVDVIASAQTYELITRDVEESCAELHGLIHPKG